MAVRGWRRASAGLEVFAEVDFVEKQFMAHKMRQVLALAERGGKVGFQIGGQENLA